jgi:uncharacterized protein YukE
MHPDLEALSKDYAEKQEAYFAAFRELDESMNRYKVAANRDSVSYYIAAEAHARVFDHWHAAYEAVEEAGKKLRDRAAELAELPPGHPLKKTKI